MSIQNHALFSDSCKGSKFVICQKMPMFDQINDESSSGPKIKFWPLGLDDVNFEGHGPKNPTPGCNLDPPFVPPSAVLN